MVLTPSTQQNNLQNTLILDTFQLGEESAPRWGVMLLWEVDLQLSNLHLSRISFFGLKYPWYNGLHFVYTIKHHPIDQSASLKGSGLMSVSIGKEMNLDAIAIYIAMGIYFIYLSTKRKHESMKCLQAAWCWDLNTQNNTFFRWTLRQMSDHRIHIKKWAIAIKFYTALVLKTLYL